MRNESTLRNNDEKKSDIVSKFIEENFYKLKNKKLFKNYKQRTTDSGN